MTVQRLYFGLCRPVHHDFPGFGREGSPLFVSKWALAFTAFVGANLFQSGFTNFCPLGIILKKLGVPESQIAACVN